MISVTPGISLTPIEQGVQFDMDGDGIRDQMAWTAGEDGILAFDLDRSGTIQSGKEIVSPWFSGGNFADSLAALATLDGNHDGRIDAHDADFGKLLVWQDLNHDGVSDPDELYGLADLGITGIALAATPLDGYLDGQMLLAQGTFSRADGGTGEFVEVAFDWRAGQHHGIPGVTPASTETRTAARSPFAVASMRPANGAPTWPGQHQRAVRGAMLQHHAAARARLLDVGVLREIPVRVIDLQQVMKHVADEGRRAAPPLSSLNTTWPGEWPGAGTISMWSLSRCGAADQIGAAGLDHRQHAFAERAELGRRGLRVEHRALWK